MYNLQGDVVAITNSLAEIVAKYNYDAWGKVLSVTNASGTVQTSASFIGNINPIRYRGYYYDVETGLYYLQSRYYDPETGRFVNADGLVQTGTGLMDKNMYAYCLDDPVSFIDPNGESVLAAIVLGAIALGVATICDGCSQGSTPEPYASPDEAAKAFAESTYGPSQYIRHEYSADIYSRNINGQITYNYTTPRSGKPHSAPVGGSIPKGTQRVAYVHTHPNSNSFSTTDIMAAANLQVDGYVVGPNLILQRYNLATDSIDQLGTISPVALTASQKESLTSRFRVSWDNHISEGCGFGCENMPWPTP
jgi:RHS repeat-associated protein